MIEKENKLYIIFNVTRIIFRFIPVYSATTWLSIPFCLSVPIWHCAVSLQLLSLNSSNSTRNIHFCHANHQVLIFSVFLCYCVLQLHFLCSVYLVSLSLFLYFLVSFFAFYCLHYFHYGSCIFLFTSNLHGLLAFGLTLFLIDFFCCFIGLFSSCFTVLYFLIIATCVCRSFTLGIIVGSAFSLFHMLIKLELQHY